ARRARLGRRLGAARLPAERFGLVYQPTTPVAHLSLSENLAAAQHLSAGATSRSWREAVLERVGIAHRAHARPGQLSGGELARAGLAVALANDPPVVLADEPTGELDDTTAAGIPDLLADRALGGSAVIVVTHDPAVAARADREIALRDGEVQSC